jgi:hypothetical protein
MLNKGIGKYKMQKHGGLYSCEVAFLVWSDWGRWGGGGGRGEGGVLALKLKSATMKDKNYM